jgi:hypothetical protein
MVEISDKFALLTDELADSAESKRRWIAARQASSDEARTARKKYHTESQDESTGARERAAEESPPVPHKETDREDPTHDVVNFDDAPNDEYSITGTSMPNTGAPLDLGSDDDAQSQEELSDAGDYY